jgi:hypothetical protein
MALPAPLPPRVAAKVIPVSGGTNRISAQLGSTITPNTKVGGDVAIPESYQLVIRMQAGETKTIPLPGLSYYFGFVGTTGGVPNNYNGLEVRALQKGQPRSKLIHVQGTGLRFGTFSFSGLEIVNLDGANALEFTIVISGGVPQNSYDEFIDKRVILAGAAGSVVVTTAPGVNLTVQNGVTFTVGYATRDVSWADSLGAGATQAVTDGYLGKARKSIIFANDDNAAILTVLDAGGATLGSIQPGTSWTTDTGGTITLQNPSGGAVSCHIGEVYYS